MFIAVDVQSELHLMTLQERSAARSELRVAFALRPAALFGAQF